MQCVDRTREVATVLFLPRAELAALFGRARYRAFQFEVEDEHVVSDEHEPMRRYLAGLVPLDPDDYPVLWKEWEDLSDATTARGVAMQRVRVVTEPLTDYIRFLHAVTDRNQAHGEEIRWLPRHRLRPDDYTTDEWCLIDDDTLAWTLFDDEDFVGYGLTRDPIEVGRAVAVRDALWEKAVPHTDYLPGAG
ncbi:DUF6879 family protein [Nocardia asteroides]|uniref:DUF6879 family protein n=1 Tax=Nocardia asteroides TaxID=1824 RepID=UPI0037928934